MTPTRRALLVALVLGGTATGTTAQVPAGVPRVGILFLGVTGAEAVRASGTANEGNSFESGMRALGDDEGRSVIFERCDARPAAAARRPGGRAHAGEGRRDRGRRSEVLAAARRAIEILQIVTGGGSDQVEEGWAGSLARPVGKRTG